MRWRDGPPVSYNRAVDPAFLDIVRCPRCRGEHTLQAAAGAGGRSLRCSRCDLEAPVVSPGFVELLDTKTLGEPTAATTEQRFMESPLVARVYDRVWRPTFVRLLAGKGAGGSVGAAGELFIHRHSLSIDDRQGPWLDLSCGPGMFARSLAASAPGALVVGPDISRAMLEVAASRTAGYGNVQLVRGDAHALPFADESFGGVNNPGALHVYDDPEQVFREVLRVLRPGGLYVGSTFAEAPSLLGKVTARLAGIRRFAPSELRAWLGRIGFADYEDLRLGDALIFRARRP